MGVPADRAAIPRYASDRRLPAGLLAFPSPASVTDELDSPTLSRSLAGVLWTPRSLLPDAANTLPSEPGVVSTEPIMSPPLDSRVESNMDFIVGGALAPVHTTPPPRPRRKTGPGLRLPSFEALGIAAPHPDRFEQLAIDGAWDEAVTEPMQSSMIGPMSVSCTDAGLVHAFNASHIGPEQKPDLLDLLRGNAGGRAISSPVQHYVATITPPAESGDLHFPSMATVSHAPLESPATDPGDHTTRAEAAPTATVTAGADAGPAIRVQHLGLDSERSWITDAVDTLVRNIQSVPEPSNPLRVLSHALPCPSATGHIYPTILSSIHDSTPTSPTVWINVFHAIPGRFNLADLPTSPPSTPGPPIGGEDYFTQKVFDSAVPISDYQDDLSSLPRSPRPVVPPSSVNISIVERYIPPSTTNEFLDMFNPNGPSILVDRLVELSPNNGNLVFIYPTRSGAQTFMRDYLGPILDPLLRSTCVVHGLSSDLSRTLGSMVAVDRLLEYESMSRHVAHLCATLTQRSTSIRRFHGRRARFTLEYTAKKEVSLNRESWAKDWWTKQEKPRVRDVVTRYAQEAQKKSSNEHVDRPATPAELIQLLLDGVAKKPYQMNRDPTRGVEVSVFIIQRSE